MTATAPMFVEFAFLKILVKKSCIKLHNKPKNLLVANNRLLMERQKAGGRTIDGFGLHIRRVLFRKGELTKMEIKRKEIIRIIYITKVTARIT